MSRPIRVLVIDDSAFNRRTIVSLLEKLPGVEVVGTAGNGRDGLKQAANLMPDLITLDLEMPVMDGFTFLRILMETNPIPVIVISSKDGDVNIFKAMELGAVDFILKPTRVPSALLLNIKDELALKIKTLPYLKVNGITKNVLQLLHGAREGAKAGIPVDYSATVQGGETLFDVIAIGASTGGPPALSMLLSQFPEEFPLTIVVSQHMLPGFTKPFSERLDRLCKMKVKEAEDDEDVRRGEILIAPGGCHLCFSMTERGIKTNIRRRQEEDRYVPSVDIMFSSVASVWKERAMGVVLTGMGHDGSVGVTKIKEQGGYIIAQSEETSVVFGMPESAIATGKVDEIIPLHGIGPKLIKGAFAGFVKRA